MTNRIELNEEQLDGVVGGAWTFFVDDEGKPAVNIDGYGTYHCGAGANNKYIQLYIKNPKATLDELVQMAKAQGIIW